MPRFTHMLPFSPLYDFQACKPVTLNGRQMVPGDRLTTEERDALGARRLLQMYESRLITPIPPEVVPAVLQPKPEAPLPDYAWSEGAGGGDVLADGGSFDPVAPDAGQVAAPTAVHKGFGRWYVQYPDGTEAGPMSKEAAEAQVSV